MHIIFDDFMPHTHTHTQNNMHSPKENHSFIQIHTQRLTMRAIKFKADAYAERIHIILWLLLRSDFMLARWNESVAWMIPSEMIKSFDTVISSL